MGSKHDMYINYGRSYKRRGKRGNNKNWFILIIIIVAIILGISAFLVIKTKVNTERKASVTPTEAAAVGLTQEEKPSPSSMPTTIPTEAPTLKPTPTDAPQPTEEVTSDTDSDNLGEGKRSAPVVAKGIYISAGTAGSDRMNSLINMTETTEINALVIDVKGDTGKISYQMDSPLAKEIGAVTNTVSDMSALVNKLKSKNIYLIARIVAFKDPYLAEKRHDLAIKNKDGSLFRDNNGECWVNPYNQEVWDYLVELATQAAAIGFDEIQFDYIRFSTGKGIMDADFGELAKTKSKEDIITEFTKYAYQKIKSVGVYLSADVYGTIINSTIDAGLVGQNYIEMSKYLDYICPMIYPSHFGEGNYGIKYPDLEPYNVINKVLNVSKEKLSQIPKGEHRAIVRPWLQDFTATWVKPHMTYSSKEIRDQIDGVYNTGYQEWLLWNASCKYTEEGLLKE